MTAYLRLLHPVRVWRRSSGRARTYLLGLLVFVAAEIGGLSGALPYPIALAMFAAGCLIAAAAIRPADRGKSS